MVKRSFSLLRTNVGLTTNIKVVVTSDYNLYVESIESTPELSLNKYKKVSFNKDNYYDEIIPYFFKDTPSEIAYFIKYDNDNHILLNDFKYQYDDTYIMGARNIKNNKEYKEEYEYFAPLYFERGHFPKFFVIFRVDGPGLLDLNKDNFRTEILNKFKCVKVFDLTKNTPLGEWIERNFIKNDLFPTTPLEVDFRKDEFTKWYGIDYETGGYTYKSIFMNDVFEYENLIFDLEKFIFDGYLKNKIVFPNIINFSFLFDDTPATKTSLRKWSINRYYGFYINEMDLVTSISPYIPVNLKSDIYIDSDNNIKSLSSNYPFDDVVDESEFNKREYYIEYSGNFYKVEQYEETLPPGIGSIGLQSNSNVFIEDYVTSKIYRYKIISDISLFGKESELNKNICYIDDNNFIRYYNNSNYFDIPEFESADVWLIEIDGKYHNLIKEDGKIKLNTDYGFEFYKDKFIYYINKPDPKYTKVIDLTVNKDDKPKVFKIFRLNFTDIKDFDTCIVDTEFSKYEYEKEEDITRTDETKMYFPNLKSKSYPKDLDDYIYKGEVVNIPVSSEYTANLETFRIINNELTELWRKNSVYCRWGFKDSLSSNDYPYLLNNSNVFEDFNRTVNPFNLIPSRVERNLDYFYTINSSTSSYTHHTLHVENHDQNGYIDNTFEFNLGYYLNNATYSVNSQVFTYSFDYFSYFFSKKTFFNNGKIIKNTKKYSIFDRGDEDTPNTTLFRGIKFSIYDIENVKYENDLLNNINIKPSNSFDGYKFSILLSDNGEENNNMEWIIIDEWDSRRVYSTGSIVVYDDVLYISIAETGPVENVLNNNIAPYEYQNVWVPHHVSYSVLWNPSHSYISGDVVYNSGEYYVYNSNGTISFWNPYVEYNEDDCVIYKNNYWISTVNNNNKKPPVSASVDNNPYWKNINSSVNQNSCSWVLINLWEKNKYYFNGDYVVYNNVVYKCLYDDTYNVVPLNSDKWVRVYSIEPDTDFVYKIDNNPLILMNDKYYLLTNNPENSTLQNGINIYINKKWKNILINIFIGDNTIKNISETDRDELYGYNINGLKYTSEGLKSPVNSKLTAANFINCINDLSNKYGFTDYLNYIVIEENGDIKKFNYKNLDGLKHLIKCEYPDEVRIRVDSLNYSIDKTYIDLLKCKKILKGGVINNLKELNYYNKDLPISYKIEKNEEFRSNDNEPHRILIENFHGLNNVVYNSFYRYSGNYTPIFYEIELFERPNLTTSLCGNYKFDTSLTYFGIMKQRIISKININKNVLKLKDREDFKSIYPMLDEFGYTFVDHFIFKSNWDFKFYIECDVK